MKLHVRSMLFRSPRSKLLAAGASFAAIALFTLILPATVASGTSASTSTLGDGGVLRLALGTTDQLTFHEPDGAGGYEVSAAGTQSISTSSGCRLAPAVGDLVAFSAAPNSAFPGFVSDAIGVRGTGDGNGQPCGRIDAPGQKLTLDLGGVLDGKVIDYAEIDLELKFGATATITGFLGGTPVLAQNYSSTGSDSGPDSADGDNYRVRFPQTGTTTADRLDISIFTPTGGASLEGGADGTPACDGLDSPACAGDGSLGGPSNLNTTDTLFHLLEVDGVLDCNETAPTQGGGGTPTNILERLDNVDGAACTPIPFNLDSGPGVGAGCPIDSPQCILLQKDLLGQDARFFWTVTWVAESAEYPEAPTLFDFGDGYNPLLPCGPDADGVLPFIPTLPGNGDPWCIVETHTVEQLDGQVIVTEKYFGSGDPLGKRG